MAATSLSIILPAFNEEARLGPALDELFGYLRSAQGLGAALPAAIEVLVVDDGSTDGTAALVRARPEYTSGSREAETRAAGASAAGASAPASDPPGDRPDPELHLLGVPHAGKGAAVRAGMLSASGDLLVFADADMATPPDQLPLLVRALGSAEVALGSRRQPDGSDMRASQPPFRRFVGRAFRFAARFWVSGPISDTQCGFKGFRRAAGRDLFGRQRITSIVFDAEIIYLARRRHFRIAVVPVVWADRRGSRMHARPRLALRVAWDLFRIPLLHRGVRSTRSEPAEGTP